jgi:hypothetical protein
MIRAVSARASLFGRSLARAELFAAQVPDS